MFVIVHKESRLSSLPIVHLGIGSAVIESGISQFTAVTSSSVLVQDLFLLVIMSYFDLNDFATGYYHTVIKLFYSKRTYVIKSGSCSKTFKGTLYTF